MAEGRPSSLQGKGNAGTNRRRRSPNLGIATLALDALGNVLGIDALGSSISPAEAALALFATRKILYHSINMVHPRCSILRFVPSSIYCSFYLPRFFLQTDDRTKKPSCGKSFLQQEFFEKTSEICVESFTKILFFRKHIVLTLRRCQNKAKSL